MKYHRFIVFIFLFSNDIFPDAEHFYFHNITRRIVKKKIVHLLSKMAR